MLFKKVMVMWVVKNKHQNAKAIEKAKRCQSRILWQQVIWEYWNNKEGCLRKHSGELLKWWKCWNWGYWVTTKKGGCLRKHSGRLLKQWVIQESTQMSYQNNESFKKALRWAIEMTKMSKSRISSNNKRGHLRKHSDRLSKLWVIQESTQMSYWNDENVKTENIK